VPEISQHLSSSTPYAGHFSLELDGQCRISQHLLSPFEWIRKLLELAGKNWTET